jgi:hypothetical protein
MSPFLARYLSPIGVNAEFSQNSTFSVSTNGHFGNILP